MLEKECFICDKTGHCAPDCPDSASLCSSGSAERQDAAKAMCEAIAAFKPVCDQIALSVVARLLGRGLLTFGDSDEARAVISDLMQTTLRELTEKANSTPA